MTYFASLPYSTKTSSEQSISAQAIFDTFRLNITDGLRRVLALSYHFERMQVAIKERAVNGPRELQELTDRVKTASTALSDGDYRIRVLLPPQTSKTPQTGTPEWSMEIFPWTSKLQHATCTNQQTYGIKVLPLQGAIRNDPLFKTWGARSISMQARQRALAADYDEALLIGEKEEILEGDWSNFFALCRDELLTPPLSAGVLPGIIRRLIMEIVPTREKQIALSDLSSATEAFFTRATDYLVPIRQIGALSLPSCNSSIISTLSKQLLAYYEVI